MRSLKTLLTVIGAVTVLVLAGNTVALAATGHALILGQTNKANKITTLKRTTPGSALQLKTTSASAAPLAVNGTGRVANLNADRVDGLEGSALRTHSYVWHATFTGKTEVILTLPLANGSYLVSYSNFFNGLGAASLECFLTEDDAVAPDRYTAYTSTNNDQTAGTFSPALSGSGMVTKTSTNAIVFDCDAVGGTFGTDTQTPLEIVATPTTVVTSGTLSVP